MKKKKAVKGKKNKVEKTIKEEVVVVEEKKSETIFNKIISSKLIDVLLVIVAICLLLFIHHYALVVKDTDNYVYYVNEEGLPHFFDMDSYYYSRKTKEFVNGTETNIITYRSKDNLQTNLSDRDDSRYTLLLSKIVSIIYKIVTIFKHVSLYRVIIYSSAILSTLVAIPTYIFIKKRTSRMGGFFASVLAGSSVAYFSHWTYGCFDTDVLLYTLPVIYICSFIESMIEKENKKRIIWIIISSIAFILLMMTWDVFGVYYFLTVGSTLLILLVSLFKEKFIFKNVLKLPEVIYSFVNIISYTILSFIVNKGIDISILRDIISVVKPNKFSSYSYPNPGKYTSELAKIDFITIKDGTNPFEASGSALVNKLGGMFIFIIFLMGLVVLINRIHVYLRDKKEENKSDYIAGLILIIWAIGGLISTKMGLRFVKIATIPVTLITAYGIGIFYKQFKVRKAAVPVIFLSLALLITPCLGAQKIADNMSHSADDALAETGDYIKANTKEDAVVVSWWDYGYFFEFQSERRALADGGTYNGRFLYYLANGLSTVDELTSVNIFKMLATSGTTVSYVAEEYFETPKKVNEVLMKVFAKKTAEEANKLLIEKYNLTEEQASNITKYTHPQVDYEIVLVITSSMLRMKSAINYFAHYDFETGKTTQNELAINSVYLTLYDKDDDTEYYKHLYRNTDVTTKLSTNVFVIK